MCSGMCPNARDMRCVTVRVHFEFGGEFFFRTVFVSHPSKTDKSLTSCESELTFLFCFSLGKLFICFHQSLTVLFDPVWRGTHFEPKSIKKVDVNSFLFCFVLHTMNKKVMIVRAE